MYARSPEQSVVKTCLVKEVEHILSSCSLIDPLRPSQGGSVGEGSLGCPQGCHSTSGMATSSVASVLGLVLSKYRNYTLPADG